MCVADVTDDAVKKMSGGIKDILSLSHQGNCDGQLSVTDWSDTADIHLFNFKIKLNCIL